jgi:hypothetical protein
VMLLLSAGRGSDLQFTTETTQTHELENIDRHCYYQHLALNAARLSTSSTSCAWDQGRSMSPTGFI